MNPREALGTAGLLVAGLLAGSAISEVGLRLYTQFETDLGRELAEWDPRAVLIEPHGNLGYRQKPNSTYRYPNGTWATSNTLGFRGETVPTPKPQHTLRIALLGGSTTHGWGVNDDATIDVFLRRLLAERFPGRGIEVVNLAFDGYDAYQVAERFQTEHLRFQPDLVIVNSGINDVRNAKFPNLQERDRRTVIWADVLERLRAEAERGGPSLWSRIKHRSLLARLPGVLKYRRTHRPATTSTAPMAPNEQAIDHFERQLARMAALASSRGITVLFSTPPSALRSKYPPNATSSLSYWIGDAATTQHFRDKLDWRMRQLVDHLRAGGHDVAYVSHDFPPDMFLDDCHLTPEGNLQLAGDFADAIAPFITSRPLSGGNADRDEPVAAGPASE